MKLYTYIFIMLILTSCLPKIKVSYGPIIRSLNESIFVEEELIHLKVLDKSSSNSVIGLQNCSYEYVGMNQNVNGNCLSLANFDFDISTATLSWGSSYEQNGIYRFNITLAEDGVIKNSKPVVEIKRKNRIPVITNATSITLVAGNDLNFALLGNDPDVGVYDDVLSFSCISCPSGLSIDPLNNVVYASSLIGTNNFSFSIEVSDQYGGASQKVFNAIVVSSNVAPVLSSVSDVTTGENTPITINLSAVDSDGNPIEYSFSCDSPCTGAAIDSTSGEFSWTPSFTSAGTYDIIFYASDGSLSHSQNATITVTNTNRAPSFISLSDLTHDEGDDILISLLASDPDSDTISLSYACDPICPGAVFNSTLGTFSWATDNTMAGEYEVSFTATDNYIPSASTTETITIEIIDVNRSPVLASVANRSLILGQNPTPTISLVASDPDGDSLVYSFNCTPACSGASINSGTGVFSWSPPVGSIGTYAVTFSVSDSTAITSQSSTITVSATNTLPVFAAIKDRVTRTQEEEIINFSATDADGDTLSYTCHILDINLAGNEALEVENTHATCASASFLSFEPADGRLVFNTANSDVGFYRVLLIAHDTKGVRETRFSVSVNREIMELVIKPNYSGSLSYLLPVRAKTNKKYIVDWGDSTAQTLSANYPTHTYLNANLSTNPACLGCINIKVGGQLDRIHHYNSFTDGSGPNSSQLNRTIRQLYKVESIGDLYWNSLSDGFSDCKILISINSGFVSNTFTSASFLFDYNDSLASADLNGFDASNVLDAGGLYHMFDNTPQLKNVSFAGINTAGVKNFEGLFSNSSIETVDMNSLNFSGAQNLQAMFYRSKNIKNVDFSNVVIPNVTRQNLTFESTSFINGARFDAMFMESEGEIINFSNAEISTDVIDYMFHSANFDEVNFSGSKFNIESNARDVMWELTARKVDFSNVEFENVNSLDGFFEYSNIDFITFDNANIHSGHMLIMSEMFADAEFEKILFSNMTISSHSAGVATGMFSNAQGTYLDFSNTDFDNITTVGNIFNLASIETVTFESADISSFVSNSKLFDYSDIININFTGANMIQAYNLSLFIGQVSNTRHISFKDVIAGNYIELEDFLEDSNNLQEADLSGFVGKGIEEVADNFLRNAGSSYAGSVPTKINFSKYNSSTLVYDSINKSGITSSWSFATPMNPNFIFYCDYTVGAGFGDFLGKSCTDPASYVETPFPAPPIL